MSESPKHLTPPFLFKVTFQMRLPGLKFRYDVIEQDDKKARELAESLLVPAVKAAIEAGKYEIGDLRPLYAEISSAGEDEWAFLGE